MTTPATDPLLLRYTASVAARPLPAELVAARDEVKAAVRALRGIPDASLTVPWAWKGGSEEELRYGFYRIGEAFELARIEAETAIRRAGLERGPAGDRIAQATEARWDLQGLLLPLPDSTWDADPGGGEWTVRRTLGHVISAQRGYGVGTAWWQDQALPAGTAALPTIPESILVALPAEEAEAEGATVEVRDRLDDLLDRSTERLAGLPEERLAYGARWSGFPVDVGFRLGRWSSHLREHTIQVEKTLAMLGHRPTEVDRLLRLVLAAWGRAEATVYGHADASEAVRILVLAAAEARETAVEVAELARA